MSTGFAINNMNNNMMRNSNSDGIGHNLNDWQLALVVIGVIIGSTVCVLLILWMCLGCKMYCCRCCCDFNGDCHCKCCDDCCVDEEANNEPTTDTI